MAQTSKGVSHSRKSTTVRIEKWAVSGLRATYSLGFRVVPDWAEASVVKRFLSPRRPPKPAEPEVEGVRAERQVRRVGGNEIVSWSWGEGPEVLLVHGWEGRAKQFERLVPMLLGLGFRATAVDLPAHGVSSGTTATIVDFAHAVRAIADEREPLHAVVAHSFGGVASMVAMLERPLASGAVLLAPAAEPSWFTDRAADLLGVPPRHRAGMQQRVEARAGRRYEDIDLRRREGSLSLPVLVLHDPADAEVPLSHGEAAARVSVRGRLEPLPGLGHRRLMRDPSVVERVGRFVAEDIPRAAPAEPMRALATP